MVPSKTSLGLSSDLFIFQGAASCATVLVMESQGLLLTKNTAKFSDHDDFRELIVFKPQMPPRPFCDVTIFHAPYPCVCVFVCVAMISRN